MSDTSNGDDVAVVGGGPAGLMAAEVLANAGARVVIYERMPSLGRKFLLAGRGGLNLTHSEPLEAFLGRYGAAQTALAPAIRAFDPTALREWCAGLGQTTFEGSSGRVFPKSMKTSPLLRAWLRRLADRGVAVRLRHRFTGWREGKLLLATPEGELAVAAKAVVLALGGASWPQLGSDGGWTAAVAAQGVLVRPLRAANSGLLVTWSEILRTRFAGAPLKRIALSYGAATERGEAVITATGIEGGAVYGIGRHARAALETGEPFVVTLDLRPDESAEQIVRRLERPQGKRSLKEHLRRQLNLAPAAIGLIQEAARAEEVSARDWERLSRLIKAVPLTVRGSAPIGRAISTAGGIALEEVDADFMLKKMPGVLVAGEMLDWEAPTGGYLLQASLATGAAAGRGALAWISRAPRPQDAPPDRSPTAGGTPPDALPAR
ncbi:MAG: TIGR03862 family flavoprotein [Hyphomicrobiaceae bacterium]|nr:TIGR03862 family flavoprotein [Hyphomicrobiaceae bacterium]